MIWRYVSFSNAGFPASYVRRHGGWVSELQPVLDSSTHRTRALNYLLMHVYHLLHLLKWHRLLTKFKTIWYNYLLREWTALLTPLSDRSLRQKPRFTLRQNAQDLAHLRDHHVMGQLGTKTWILCKGDLLFFTKRYRTSLPKLHIVKEYWKISWFFQPIRNQRSWMELNHLPDLKQERVVYIWAPWTWNFFQGGKLPSWGEDFSGSKKVDTNQILY